MKTELTLLHKGLPDYQGLTKAEKRSFLLPLVETIRVFYQDPDNRAKYQDWLKNEYKEEPA